MNNKIKLLSSLCTAIASIGWILIVGGIFWLIVFFSKADKELLKLGEMQFLLYGISAVSFDFFFVGLAAVIISRLTRFIFVRDSEPTLMLRCGDKILYLFAAFGIYWALFRHFIFSITIEDSAARFIYEQPALLPTLGKAVILLLLGQILKRLLPVIQEYKTLV